MVGVGSWCRCLGRENLEWHCSSILTKVAIRALTLLAVDRRPFYSTFATTVTGGLSCLGVVGSVGGVVGGGG